MLGNCTCCTPPPHECNQALQSACNIWFTWHVLHIKKKADGHVAASGFQNNILMHNCLQSMTSMDPPTKAQIHFLHLSHISSWAPYPSMEVAYCLYTNPWSLCNLWSVWILRCSSTCQLRDLSSAVVLGIDVLMGHHPIGVCQWNTNLQSRCMGQRLQWMIPCNYPWKNQFNCSKSPIFPQWGVHSDSVKSATPHPPLFQQLNSPAGSPCGGSWNSQSRNELHVWALKSPAI